MQFLLINANCSLDLRRVSKEKRKKWSMGKQRGCLRGKENILGEQRKHKRKEKEFREVDAWIKKNTLERFGPVRSVTPHHVFEIAFEGIAFSKRHKSGVATRFPRILRWRKDKKITDANNLDDLKSLIPSAVKDS